MARFHTISGIGMALAMAATLLAPAQAQSGAVTQAATQRDAANPAMPLYTSFEVIEKLQKGGLVMLIRHERTEMPSRADDYSKPAHECRAQRNLSVAGVVNAAENGDLLKAAGIKVARVITSPMCRSAETARYMFGVEYTTDARLMHHEPGAKSKRPLNQAAKETRAAISELGPVSSGANIALISHGGNIFKATGLRLSEGEIGVLSVDKDGTITPLGQVTGSTLGFFARMKQSEDETGE